MVESVGSSPSGNTYPVIAQLVRAISSHDIGCRLESCSLDKLKKWQNLPLFATQKTLQRVKMKKTKRITRKVIDSWQTSTLGCYELELECGHIVSHTQFNPLRELPKTKTCSFCMGTDLISNSKKNK